MFWIDYDFCLHFSFSAILPSQYQIEVAFCRCCCCCCAENDECLWHKPRKVCVHLWVYGCCAFVCVAYMCTIAFVCIFFFFLLFYVVGMILWGLNWQSNTIYSQEQRQATTTTTTHKANTTNFRKIRFRTHAF